MNVSDSYGRVLWLNMLGRHALKGAYFNGGFNVSQFYEDSSELEIVTHLTLAARVAGDRREMPSLLLPVLFC